MSITNSVSNLKEVIYQTLSQDKRLWTVDNELNQTLLIHLLEKTDARVVELLFQQQELRNKFFLKLKTTYVFKINEFRFFMEESKVDNSYTAYKNRIGLTAGKRFIKDAEDIVLSFPYKDCVLQGGQSTEEGMDTYFAYEEEKEKIVQGEKTIEPADYKKKQAKRKEIFFNEVLAQDEKDRLFDEKALVGWKRYTAQGEEEIQKLTRDENGTLRENMIIKGNNLLALHSLKRQFTGKVKLIYIDPPYNTGNDGFQYNDKFNHSTWLTFMKNRLEVARALLREDGVIFVQCDDNEQAYLKVLMDDVFGRENFITTFVWEKTQHFGRQKINYYSNAECIIAYAKKLRQGKHIRQLFIEKNIKDFDDAPLYNASNPEKVLFIPYNKCILKLKDGIYKASNNKKFVLLDTVEVKNNKPINSFSIKFKSRWTNETLKKELAKGGTVLIKSEKFSPRIIYHEDKASFVAPKKIIFTNRQNPLCANVLGFYVGTTSTGSTENEKLFNSKIFNYPKPESLIGYLIQITTQPKDIILDYHLGSGTTAAVAHKMGRQYIGIEQMDYIETIACERMKKVIAGEQGGISKSVQWQGGGDFVYMELAEWNEKAKKIIQEAKSLERLKSFFHEMCDKYFLHYNLKVKDFTEKVIHEEAFQALSLAKQKSMFLTMLDLNQMYVCQSEMNDPKFAITSKDQNLTKAFYE